MAGRDWNNLGQDLNRIIEDAVHMRSFGNLNRNINDALRRAFQMDDGENRSGSRGWDFNLSGERKYSSHETEKSQNGAHQADVKKNAYGTYRPIPSYFAGSGRRKGGSVAKLAGGIILAACSFGSGIMSIAGWLFLGTELTGKVFSVMGLVFLLAGIALIISGARGLGLAKRFESYIKCLKGDSFIDIKKLADYCHLKEDFVLKDIKKMMNRGWFVEGHLDHNETCLMVSHEAYEQYMLAVRNAKIRDAENRRQREAQAATNDLTPEERAVIDKGKEYIEAIRKSNDAIPGEVISEKIYKMELLVKRIFQQVEAHPENISDLRKFMEYYLPMTVKLLGAYEELDKQPIQGENIKSSKHEIEETLDTLNAAFAKLLDNLFQDTAWDVSSDISVLEAMLAQEGLMKDDFIDR